MTVLMPNEEYNRLTAIVEPYLVYSKKPGEHSYLSEDAPEDVKEANYQLQKLIKKEKELDELWMY